MIKKILRKIARFIIATFALPYAIWLLIKDEGLRLKKKVQKKIYK